MLEAGWSTLFSKSSGRTAQALHEQVCSFELPGCPEWPLTQYHQRCAFLLIHRSPDIIYEATADFVTAWCAWATPHNQNISTCISVGSATIIYTYFSVCRWCLICGNFLFFFGPFRMTYFVTIKYAHVHNAQFCLLWLWWLGLLPMVGCTLPQLSLFRLFCSFFRKSISFIYPRAFSLRIFRFSGSLALGDLWTFFRFAFFSLCFSARPGINAGSLPTISGRHFLRRRLFPSPISRNTKKHREQTLSSLHVHNKIDSNTRTTEDVESVCDWVAPRFLPQEQLPLQSYMCDGSFSPCWHISVLTCSAMSSAPFCTLS